MGPGKKLLARFWSRVDQTGDCWLWTGPVSSTGYGVVNDGKTTSAHRWIYQALNGALPRSTEVHHRCETKRCVRPDHLVPVTKAEHSRLHFGQKRKRPIPVDKPVIALLNANPDKLLTQDEFIDLLRANMNGETQKSFAQKLGITPCSLGNVLLRKKRPGPDLLSLVGFERVDTFEVVDRSRWLA